MILIQSLRRLRLRNKWLSGSCWCISLHLWILKPGASAAQRLATVLGDHSSEREVYLSCGFFVSSCLFSFLSHQTMESWLTEITHKLPMAKSKDLFPHSYRTRFCPAFYIIDHPFSWNLSTLAWKIPWMEEPGRLRSMGSQRVGHDCATSLSLSSSLPSFHALSCFFPTPSAHSFSLSSASLSLCSFFSENSLFQGCNPHPHSYLPPLKSHHPCFPNP